MAAYAVIDVETVLAQDKPSLPFQERESNLGGVRLYAALYTQYQLILVHNREHELVSTWLKMHGFNNWMVLHKNPTLEAYNYLRQTHRSLDLWVTGDPVQGRSLIREGMNVLLYSQSGYSRGEWRPDHDLVLKPWDAIEEELREERVLRDNDRRLVDGESGRFE